MYYKCTSINRHYCKRCPKGLLNANVKHILFAFSSCCKFCFSCESTQLGTRPWSKGQFSKNILGLSLKVIASLLPFCLSRTPVSGVCLKNLWNKLLTFAAGPSFSYSQLEAKTSCIDSNGHLPQRGMPTAGGLAHFPSCKSSHAGQFGSWLEEVCCHLLTDFLQLPLLSDHNKLFFPNPWERFFMESKGVLASSFFWDPGRELTTQGCLHPRAVQGGGRKPQPEISSSMLCVSPCQSESSDSLFSNWLLPVANPCDQSVVPAILQHGDCRCLVALWRSKITGQVKLQEG